MNESFVVSYSNVRPCTSTRLLKGAPRRRSERYSWDNTMLTKEVNTSIVFVTIASIRAFVRTRAQTSSS